jgi:transposase
MASSSNHQMTKEASRSKRKSLLKPRTLEMSEGAEGLRSVDTRVARRILAIANALDGMSREAAARSAGMDRQTLRDWVLRYNEHGIDGLADRWGDGRPPTFDAQEQAELMHIVLDGPDPEASGLSAYTLEDLANICEQRFGKRMHPWSLGRLLRRLGFSRQKTRPSHPQKDPAAQAAFKKSPSAAQKNTAYA